MADDDNKTRKVALTNNDSGPRFVYAGGGQVVLRSGETRTLTMSALELRAIGDEVVDGTDDAPRWSVDKPAKDDAGGSGGTDAGPKALGDMTIAQLRQVADAEGVDLTGKSSKADILQAVQDKRDSKSPAPKPLADQDDAELRATATAEGVELAADADRDTIVKAIEAKRGQA